jgi:polyisoprenoid-binding protein YceI
VSALLALMTVASVSALSQQIDLKLDPAKTTVKFSLDAALHTVHGTFQVKPGALQFDPASGQISGAILVDAKSGVTVNVHGILRIHGVEREITVPAQVEMAADLWSATVHFTIPYAK